MAKKIYTTVDVRNPNQIFKLNVYNFKTVLSSDKSLNGQKEEHSVKVKSVSNWGFSTDIAEAQKQKTNNVKIPEKDKRVIKSTGDKIKDFATKLDVSSRGTTAIANIVLPLPNELLFTYSHNYDSSEMNLTQDAVDVGTSVLSSLNNSFTKFFNISSIINGFGKMAKRAGVVFNPHLVNYYKNTNPRMFTFTFILMPTSKREADNTMASLKYIKDISKASQFFGKELLSMKHCVTFTFGEKLKNSPKRILDEMFFTKDRTFFIYNLDYDYSAQGYIPTTDDGNLRSIRLILTLVEREPLLYDDMALQVVE